MALYGKFEDLARVLAGDPRFTEAFAYLRRCAAPGSAEGARLRALAENGLEKIPLPDGALAMEQVYVTRERRNCVLESHVQNIDVQFILEGEEVMDVMDADGLEVTRPYKEASDVILYGDPGEGGSRLRVRAGQAAIFFPEDVHLPGQFHGAPALVRKTVVKVPVSPALI
jgi:biofilm protein TabA